MRYTSIALFSVLHLALSQEIFNSFGLDSESKYKGEVTYTFDADPSDLPVLKIHNVKGDFTIHGESGSAVQIVETITVRSLNKKRAASEYEKAKTNVHYNDVNGIIQIVGPGKWSRNVSVDFDIHIPRQTSIRLYSQGGDITCKNIGGEVDVETAGGEIELYQIAGKIQALTYGGDIELSHANGHINLQTSGGDIETNDTEGILFVKTKGGDLDIELSRGNIEAYTFGGEIEMYKIEGNSVIGRSHGGDIEVDHITADMDLHTDGGDFSIQNIIGNLSAVTSAGDIDIERIIGDAVLETSAGSIHGESLSGRIKAITNTGDIIIHKETGDEPAQDIEIVNRFGDVYLILPSRMSATFDIQMDGVEDLDALESDYPLEIQHSGMLIKASGVQGSGQHTVVIRSHFGNVTLAKD